MKSITNSMNTQDSQSEITYGYDPASPEGDYSALTIRHKRTFYNFVGDDAEAIEAYVTTRVKEALLEVKKAGENWEEPNEGTKYELDKKLKALTTTTNGKGLEKHE